MNNSHLFTTDQPYAVCLPSHISTTNSTSGPGDLYLQGVAAGGFHVSRAGGDIAVNFSSSKYTVENVTTSCTGACVFLFSMHQQTQSHVGQRGYGTDLFLNLSERPVTVGCTDCIRPSIVTEFGDFITVDPRIQGPDYFTGTVCLTQGCAGGGVCELEDGECSFPATERIAGIQPLWLRMEGEYIESIHRLGTLQNDNFLRFTAGSSLRLTHGSVGAAYLRVRNLHDHTETFNLTIGDPQHIHPSFRENGRQQLNIRLAAGAQQTLAIDVRTQFCAGSCEGALTVRLTGERTGNTESEHKAFAIVPEQDRVRADGLTGPQLLVVLIISLLGYHRLT